MSQLASLFLEGKQINNHILKHKAEYQFININDKVIRNTIHY